MVGDPREDRQALFSRGPVEPVWFRRPAPGRPGTLNLCYGALDVHVVRGRAAETAVVLPDGRVRDVATVLEQTGALAGALRLLGVGVGDGVLLALDDPYDDLLAVLACARLGAPHGDPERPALLVTSRANCDGSARLLRGIPVADPDREVAWELAYKAGREDPAPCAEVPGDATAWVARGRQVACRDALSDDSAPGRLLAALTAGRAVRLDRPA